MSKPVSSEHRIASGELREAVAHGPILFRGLENVYERVLRPDAGAFAEQLGNPPEQPLLLSKGAGLEHDDLDGNDIGAAGDAVGIPVTEVRGVMFW